MHGNIVSTKSCLDKSYLTRIMLYTKVDTVKASVLLMFHVFSQPGFEEAEGGQYVLLVFFKLFFSPPAMREVQARRADVLVLFLYLFFLFMFVIPIISTSTGPISTKFAELWPHVNAVKLFFRSLKGRCRSNQFCG